MIDPNEKELIALDHGGAMGGQYLESLGRYDLSKLSQDEWRQLIRCVVGGFSDSLIKQESAIVETPPNAAASK